MTHLAIRSLDTKDLRIYLWINLRAELKIYLLVYLRVSFRVYLKILHLIFLYFREVDHCKYEGSLPCVK